MDGINSGFETQGRRHKKSKKKPKTGLFSIGGPTRRTNVFQKLRQMHLHTRNEILNKNGTTETRYWYYLSISKKGTTYHVCMEHRCVCLCDVSNSFKWNIQSLAKYRTINQAGISGNNMPKYVDCQIQSVLANTNLNTTLEIPQIHLSCDTMAQKHRYNIWDKLWLLRLLGPVRKPEAGQIGIIFTARIRRMTGGYVVCPPLRGVPQPGPGPDGGYPSQIQVQMGGYPNQVQMGEYPGQVWMGVPPGLGWIPPSQGWGTSHLDLGWSNPPPPPPTWTWTWEDFLVDINFAFTKLYLILFCFYRFKWGSVFCYITYYLAARLQSNVANYTIGTFWEYFNNKSGGINYFRVLWTRLKIVRLFFSL